MQLLCGTSKSKETADPAPDSLFTEASSVKAASRLTNVKSNVSEVTLTTARHFRLAVDIVLSHRVSLQARKAVASILQGAGLRQHSQQSWESAPCDIEESTDLLSDVFLELQALDDQAKECIELLQVSMCSGHRSEGLALTL